MSSPHPGAGPPPASTIFDGKRQILVQAGLVVCCAAASFVVVGARGAQAALAGGLCALLGTLAFVGLLRWRSRPAPTPWQALRVFALAEAMKWALSLGGLGTLLAGVWGIEAVREAPGATVTGFCVAWAAPLLALVKKK